MRYSLEHCHLYEHVSQICLLSHASISGGGRLRAFTSVFPNGCDRFCARRILERSILTKLGGLGLNSDQLIELASWHRPILNGINLGGLHHSLDGECIEDKAFPNRLFKYTPIS